MTIPDAVIVKDWHSDVPRSVARPVLFGLILMVVAFGGFGAWAFRAPLAAAVIAQGSFVATGQNKIVQHLEGGIIQEILVEEGDTVVAGQSLLKLDPTAASANERSFFLRRVRLEATEARLRAEYDRKTRLVFPDHLVEARADPEVPDILDGQLLAFRVSQSALSNDVTLFERNIDALTVRSAGYSAQLDALRRQRILLAEDFATKSELLAKGLLSRSQVIEIERFMIEAEGQLGRLEAEISEIVEVKRKYRAQIGQAVDRYRQTALDDLQKVQSELDSIREQSRTARDVRARADVIAPVAGTVVRLHYHTAGGVVESGRAIVEILPLDEPLIIEIQIPRVEIDSVREGQMATVRLSALNRRTTPLLEGKVIYVSADSISDTSTGTPVEVYVARISISSDQMSRVTDFTPTPGMPAEILIQTAERTFAQYLTRPIKDSLSRAFREQ